MPIITSTAPVKPLRLLQRASMLILPVAACAGMALLWASAMQRSMWIDEWFTYTSSRQSTLSGVLAQVMSTERQPPLDWVLVHLWMGLGGVNELWLRTFSILWVLFSAALLYLITVRLRSPATARLAAALLLLSPLVIMYGPMIRYYSFAMATVLACTLAYLHYLQSPSVRRIGLWWLSAAIVAYTNSPALAIILAQNVHVVYLILARRQRQHVRLWVPAQGVLALVYLPWLAVAAGATQRNLGAADYSSGLASLALKLLFPWYEYADGETLFPWTPAGVVLFVLFWAVTLWGWWRSGVRLWLALMTLTPVVFVAVILSRIATDITFAVAASRALFVIPFLVIAAACGLAALQPAWQAVAGGLLVVLWGLSISHIVQRQDYINPIYAVPTRAVAAQVARQVAPGSLVLADHDAIFLPYFLPDLHTRGVRAVALATDRAALPLLRTAPPQVWWITLGRDRTLAGMDPGALRRALAGAGYHLSKQWGYVPEAPSYQAVKRRLLHRPDYQYKLQVMLFSRPS